MRIEYSVYFPRLKHFTQSVSTFDNEQSLALIGLIRDYYDFLELYGSVSIVGSDYGIENIGQLLITKSEPSTSQQRELTGLFLDCKLFLSLLTDDENIATQDEAIRIVGEHHDHFLEEFSSLLQALQEGFETYLPVGLLLHVTHQLSRTPVIFDTQLRHPLQ